MQRTSRSRARGTSASAKEFVDRTLTPRAEQMLEAKTIDRDVWMEAGKPGLPRPGGPRGVRRRAGPATTASTRCSPRSSPRSTCRCLCVGIHADIVAPYLVDLTTEEQKQRWLPRFCTGELLTAIGDDRAGGRLRPGRAEDHRGRATATTGCSTGRRPSSPTATPPTWSSSPRAPTREEGQGHHAVRGRGRHGGLHPRPQARQGRPGRVRHRRAVLRGRAGPRRQRHRRGRTAASST